MPLPPLPDAGRSPPVTHGAPVPPAHLAHLDDDREERVCGCGARCGAEGLCDECWAEVLEHEHVPFDFGDPGIF